MLFVCCSLKQVNLAWINLTRGTILNVVGNLPKLQQLNLSGCRETWRDDCEFWFFSFTFPFVSIILSDVVCENEVRVKTFQGVLLRIQVIIILIIMVTITNKIKPQFQRFVSTLASNFSE